MTRSPTSYLKLCFNEGVGGSPLQNFLTLGNPVILFYKDKLPYGEED